MVAVCQQLNLCGGQCRMQWEALMVQIHQHICQQHDSNMPTSEVHLLICALIDCAPVLALLHVGEQQARQG